MKWYWFDLIVFPSLEACTLKNTSVQSSPSISESNPEKTRIGCVIYFHSEF